MWGPDLTIRAPYITGAREGGLEERGLQGSVHTHAHARAGTRWGGGQFQRARENARQPEDVCDGGREG